MTQEVLRTWWWRRQGLDKASAGLGAAEVLARTGWSRSVGGCGPYLALQARAGLSREAVDGAIADQSICELPAARGCTYVVPATDFALALRAGQGHGDAADLETARQHCGVTAAEVDALCLRLLDALDRGPQDPAQLKEMLGGAVRHLGEAGKRRGLTTTLPLALGMLQRLGEIRRVPSNGRLDQQRYRYARWRPSPLAGRAQSVEEIALELARRFYRWAAPASVKQLAWWGGLSLRAARAAVAELRLVALTEGDERLLSAEDLDALHAERPDASPRYALLGSLDNLLHLRRDVVSLLDDTDLRQPVFAERGGHKELGGMADLPHHAIVDRGRLIGLWDYDGEGRIVWRTFAPPDAGLRTAIARTEAFVREQLGDARAFSLDSPAGRGERLASLRAG